MDSASQMSIVFMVILCFSVCDVTIGSQIKEGIEYGSRSKKGGLLFL